MNCPSRKKLTKRRPRIKRVDIVLVKWALGVAAALVCSCAQIVQAEPAHAAQSDEAGIRAIFVGDIQLSRLTAEEILRKHADPWRKLQSHFREFDLRIGNLEGAIGETSQCFDPNDHLCFAISPQSVNLLKQAGFTALGLANNHSGDLGEGGRVQTVQSLAQAGISGIDLANSPYFYRRDNTTIAVVAVNRIPARDRSDAKLDTPQLRQQLRFARQMADWVVVFIHWGTELIDWAVETQYVDADWLRLQGVDLIVGSHPHVVQPTECRGNTLVAYSLGNHVFDQKYQASKKGQMLECAFEPNSYTCQLRATRTPNDSSFPQLNGTPVALPSCAPEVRKGDRIAGYHLRARSVLSPETSDMPSAVRLSVWNCERMLVEDPARPIVKSIPLRLEIADGVHQDPRMVKRMQASDAGVMLIERHYSDLDHRSALRPYVYEVTERGLHSLWRGTGLAYPLIDADTIEFQGRQILCALHSQDSFLLPESQAKASKTLAYRWNGFGFSTAHEVEAQQACAERWAEQMSRIEKTDTSDDE